MGHCPWGLTLSIKARNDLGMNEFQELVYNVGIKCDIICNDSFTTNCNHQRYLNFNPFELDKLDGMFVFNKSFRIDMSNVNRN